MVTSNQRARPDPAPVRFVELRVGMLLRGPFGHTYRVDSMGHDWVQTKRTHAGWVIHWDAWSRVDFERQAWYLVASTRPGTEGIPSHE